MQSLRRVFVPLICLAPLAMAQNSIDLLSFALPDAKIMGGAHVNAAIHSDLGQFVLSQIQSTNPALQKFMQHTGVDPRADLTEIVFATDGAPGPSVHGLVAAHGNFGNAITTIESAAPADGGTVTHLPGAVDLITVNTGETSAPNICIALYLDGTTALAGDCASVQSAVAPGTKPPVTNANLLSKAQTLRTQQDLWFTSVLPLGQFGNVVPSQLSGVVNSPLLQAIQQTSGGVKFVAASGAQASTVQVSGETLMDTAANATSLLNVANFLVNLVKTQGGSAPQAAPFLALLSNLQIAANGNAVTMSLPISEPTLIELLQQAHQQARASAGAHVHHRAFADR